MTIINPNSISGITSVTAQAGVMNFYKSDGSLSGLQLNGVNFNTTAGVSTFNDVKVRGTITYEDVKNVDSIGIVTARGGLNVTANTDTDTLNVSGISTFGGYVYIPEYLIHQGDGNTWFRFPSNDTITLGTSGSTRVIIDDGGRMGIKHQTPSSQYFNNLVVGDNNSGDWGITIRTNSSNKGVLAFSDSDSADANRYDGYIAYHHNGQSMRFHTGGANERLRITSAGKVGINEDVPQALLHVANDNGQTLPTISASFPLIVTKDSNSGIAIIAKNDAKSILAFGDTNAADRGKIQYTHTSGSDVDSMQFLTAGSERLRITGNGLKVGTTVNNNYAVIHAHSSGSAVRLHLTNANTGTTTGDGAIIMIDSSSNMEILNKENTNLEFFTNNSERMRLTAGGALLLGATSTSNVENFRIHTASSNKAIIKFTNTGTGSASGDGFEMGLNGNEHVEFWHKENHPMYFATNNTERLRITSAGKIGINQSAPDGLLHIFSASAGTVTADADADELTLENSGNVGLSLLTQSTGESSIYFGNPGTNGQKDGWIKYYHESHSTTANRRCLSFKSGGGSEKMRLTAAGALNIGAASPTVSDNGQFNCYTTTSSGKAQFVHDAGTGGLRLAGTGSGSGANLVFSNNYNSGTFSDHWTLTHNGGDDSFRFLSGGTGGTERLRLQADGKLIKYGSNINLNSAYIDFSGSISTPSTAAAIYRPADNTLAFSTANTERMRINNTGNVGIGVDPAYDLDIKAGSSARVAIDCSGGSDASIIMDGINADFVGSDYYQIKAQSSGEFAVFKASSERVRITPSGDIGINCTPTANDLASGSSFAIPKVMIQGPTSDASHHLLRLHAGTDADWNGAILTLNHSNDRGIAIYGGRSNSNRSWGSVKSIDNVGRVANCISMIGGNGAGVNRIEFYTGESTSTTQRMRIASDGGIFFYDLLGNASSGSNVKYSNSDDELRYDTSSKLLKTNITELTKYGIDTVKNLKPCTFIPQEYNEDGTITVTDETLIGFIADEMVTEVPEVVQMYPKYTLTKQKEDTEIVPAAISYDKLTVVLTKALQEAITKIETLEAKVAALEA